MLLQITKENFGKEVLSAKIPVLIDFWAPWCGPCKMLGPIIEELAIEFNGKVLVGKINVDEEPEIASNYGVMSIPTVILFDGGEVKKQSIGFVPKAKLLEMIDVK